MWQTRRILVVIGSPESERSRRRSHQLALDTLQRLPAAERWEVVLLDLTPAGRCEFPVEIDEDGHYTGDSFSRFEATELLRSIRLDYVCPFVTCRSGFDLFQQVALELKLRPLWMPRQKPMVKHPRWKVASYISAKTSILNRFTRIHPN